MSYHGNDLNKALGQAKANAALSRMPRYVYSATTGIGDLSTPRYHVEREPVEKEHYQVFPNGRVLYIRDCIYLEEANHALSTQN